MLTSWRPKGASVLKNRADDGLRTRDLQLGKLALYQLSYVRVKEYFSTPGARYSGWAEVAGRVFL